MRAERTVKRVFEQHYCQTRCRWEKPRGHKALAFFKRHSNRVVRRELKDELRQEAA
jgi:hypothetical protein